LAAEQAAAAQAATDLAAAQVAADAAKATTEQAAAQPVAEPDATAQLASAIFSEATSRQTPPAQPAAIQAPPSQPAASAATPTEADPTPSPVGKRGTTEKMTRLRSTIARRMVESLQTTAQLTATVEVDLTEISRLRDRVKDDFKERHGISLSYLPFIAQAVASALKAFPKLNASIDTDAGTIRYHDTENLGVAVDTDRGLLVPVVKNAGDLNVTGLARAITDLATRTRASSITPDDLAGATFTITNYGTVGTLLDTPIINQPQVGILGTGALVKRPVVLSNESGDQLAFRDMMFLSLSYDHRLVDGADAARFLNFIKARLERGAFEADFGL
jgi:2-oxoglutarate dehydrogenase E2 component (dihydrolipoamide succinyltransferase)